MLGYLDLPREPLVAMATRRTTHASKIETFNTLSFISIGPFSYKILTNTMRGKPPHTAQVLRVFATRDICRKHYTSFEMSPCQNDYRSWFNAMPDPLL